MSFYIDIGCRAVQRSVRYGVSRDEEEAGSRVEEKSRNEEEMEEEEGVVDRMQSWAGRGTGVRRFK